ncbi:hypothetical protein [Castellaniella sp. GW247-6E4]|uniref:ABC transporter permease n=1 Tax=Castellaniella sp. GW247-6E4 TaxID=3140380 RepID=UPI003314F37B
MTTMRIDGFQFLCNLGNILVSLLIGTLLVAGLVEWVGGDAGTALLALGQGMVGSRQAIIEIIIEATPLALCALAFLIPFKAGFFNIGAQGHLQLGALTAVFMATTMALPAFLLIPLALLASALAGAVLIAPAYLLKTRRGASEVVTTVMLDFVALEFTYAMITGPLQAPGSFFAESNLIPEQYRLSIFGVHVGVHLAIVLIVLASWVLRSTVFGFRLEALGGNPKASEALGMHTGPTLMKAVLLAGAIGGIAGGIQVMGVIFQVAEGWAKDWGFLGILVALMGRTPIGAIFAALLLAGLEIGGRHMQALTGLPSSLVYLLQSVPVLVMLVLSSTRTFRKFSTSGAGR